MSKDPLDPRFNPYTALGVSPNATDDEIKKAFRKIVRENHTDTHPDDEAAKAKLTAANRAWEILSNPQRRREYDGLATRRPARSADPVADDVARKLRDIVSEHNGSKPARTPAPRPRTEPKAPAPRQSTLDEITERVKAGRAGERPAATAPVFPTEVNAQRRHVFPMAKTIVDAARGALHDGDRITLSDGTVYSCRSVLFIDPRSTTRVRAVPPLLCRNDEVLAKINLVPRQGVVAASSAACRSFALREHDLVAEAFHNLATSRHLVAPIAEELRSIMAGDETIALDRMTIRPRTLTFIKQGKTVERSVLCAGYEILEVCDGDPADGKFRYVDTKTAQRVIENYIKLRGFAVAQARLKRPDQHIPAFSAARLRNSLRSAGWQIPRVFE